MVATPPGPPARDEAPTAAVPAFWLSVRTATAGDAGPRGLDLDGVCTCSGGPGAAWDGGAACTPRNGARVACDDPGGVDDEGSRWLGSAASRIGVRPDVDLAGAVARGERTLLLRIEDWAACAEDGKCVPAWRGCDRWHPLAGQVTAEDAGLSPVRRASGYVRDGVLVVRAEGDLLLPVVPGGATVVTLSGALLVGRLEAAASETAPARRFRLKGAVLGGRVPLASLASSLHSAPFDGGRLCDVPEAFRAVAEGACKLADTLRAASLDMQPGVTCDAVSFGLAFDADLVDVDPTVRPAKPVTDPCANRPIPSLEWLCPP